jgi:hypothetical protein
MDFHQACGELLLLLEVKLVRWLEFSGKLSQACGEPWKVYEGFDFTTTREEIKVHRLEIDVVKKILGSGDPQQRHRIHRGESEVW